MSLQGVLADFGVADVFQLIAQQRKTGVLAVENEGRTLEIYFREGSVVRARPFETRPDAALAEYLLRTGALSEHALVEAQRQQEETLEALAQVLLSSEALEPQELERVLRLVSYETIFELFLWEQGSFRFRNQELTPEQGDDVVGAEMVLLDALRMRDEWSRIRMRLPDLSVTISPVADVEEFRTRRASVESACGLSEEEVERLFHLANGRSSARRVIDLSRLGTFLGAKGLVELLRTGLLRIERPSKLSVSDRAGDEAARGRPALPLLLLGLATVTAAALLLWPAPQSELPAIPMDGLARARTEAATDRLRMALDVHRWATGHYPDSLGALRADSPPALAPRGARRYLYAPSEDGYSLHADP